MPPPEPAGRADFAALAELVEQAVARALAAASPALLSPAEAMRFCGLSRTSFYRAKATGLLPRPVAVPGAGEKYRRRDLEQFVERLRPGRGRK